MALTFEGKYAKILDEGVAAPTGVTSQHPDRMVWLVLICKTHASFLPCVGSIYMTIPGMAFGFTWIFYYWRNL